MSGTLYDGLYRVCSAACPSSSPLRTTSTRCELGAERRESIAARAHEYVTSPRASLRSDYYGQVRHHLRQSRHQQQELLPWRWRPGALGVDGRRTVPTAPRLISRPISGHLSLSACTHSSRPGREPRLGVGDQSRAQQGRRVRRRRGRPHHPLDQRQTRLESPAGVQTCTVVAAQASVPLRVDRH
jgi:hypothetical protein